MLSDVQGEGGGGGELGCWGVGECSGILDAQFLFFLLKKIENWICAMTKQHPNINRNFEKRCSFWLHCIVCGINRTIERVVNLNVTWLGFVFVLISFVHMPQCGCCSIVCLRFQVVQIKQVDCKISTKNVNNCKWKTFHDTFGQLHTRKQIVRLQLNKKKSKESQTRLMSWYWKSKPTWRKDLVTYNSSFEIGRPRSREWKNFGQCWTRGVGSRMFDNFHGRHMCILPYRLFSVTFHFGYCLRQLPRFIYLYIN